MTNRRHVRSKMVITWGAVFLLAACTSSPVGATDPSPVGGTDPTVAASAPEETAASDVTLLSEAFGPGDFVLLDPLIGLTGLSAYRASLTVSFEGTDGGEPQQWGSASEMLRGLDPPMAQLTVENTGDIPSADLSYLAETDGTAYRRDPSGACTAEVANPETSLITLLEPAGGLAGVMGAEPLGEKEIGGVDAVGYGFDERAVGQAGIARTNGEVWVAADGGHVLDYRMTSEGADDLFGDGVDGTITWQYELTDVNVPVSINLPDECPAGVIGVPMVADASNVTNVPGMLSYQTASTVADVLAFYQEKSSEIGWAAAGEAAVADTGGSVDYREGDDSITIIVRARDDGSTVTVVSGAVSSGDGETSSGGGTGEEAEGGATFEMSGGHETTGTFVFAKEFSFFGSGTWTLTFTDPANPLPAGSFLTLSLIPGGENLSFSEQGVTIIAGTDVCTFEIDHQDAGGASGMVNCTDAQRMGPGGGGIDIVVTFEVTT